MENFRAAHSRSEWGGRSVADVLEHDQGIQKLLESYSADAARGKIEYPETSRTVEEWLGRIDSRTVIDVFAEYVERSGVSLERMNIPAHVYMLPEISGASMSYNAVLNSVQINISYFDRLLQSEPEVLVEAEFLRTLFHEFAHATGRVDVRWNHTANAVIKQSTIITRTGFDVDAVVSTRVGREFGGKVTKIDAFTLFNEGITEHISHEVVQEYLRRTPHGPNPHSLHNASSIDIETQVESGRSDYDEAGHIVVSIAGALANDAGVSEETIWRGLVRQYYSGEMTSREVGDLLDEAFGVEFRARCARAENGKDLRELARSIEKITVQYPGAAQRWLEHLSTARGAR